MSKEPKIISQQIDLLKGRNMSIEDEKMATHFLANISYYRLKGYWWEMQEDKVNHQFKTDSCFDDVIDLYNFDRHFRLIVFNAIERIEIALRTKMIYYFSLSFGAEWYLDSSLFPNKRYFSDFQRKIHEELSKSSEEFIKKHYENHPKENPEAWKALEVITLGTLSKLYRNINHQLSEKNKIAQEFGLYNQRHLNSWLMTITLIRNIIAHHGRLWNRVIINKYEWPKKSQKNILNYIPDNYQRRKIFPILCAIIYLNDFISPGHNIRYELLNLFEKFENVPLYKMGFPSGWEEQPIWKII